jgi:hypothetical protein
MSASGLSLAQTHQAFLAARADGSVSSFDNLADLHIVAGHDGAGLSRAQVRQDLAAARARGELNLFDSLAYLHNTPSIAMPQAMAVTQR